MLRLVIAFLGVFLLLSAAAAAEKRVALVIGNGAYTKVPKLDNPKNDAAAMEAMFKAAGFDTVVRANDLGAATMRRALRDFSDTAHDADIAVVFYAGHGMEVSGINYLIPIDAVLERDIDARDEAVPLDRVSEILEPVKRLRLVILDACRDNPFVRSMRRTLATRTVRGGYGEIDERSLPPNTLVAYAQRSGATAEDGAGPNSPYTTALLKHLPTPGLDVELALRRVRDEVLMATRNRQEPFKYGSLGGGELPLVPRDQQKSLAPGAPVPTASEAERAWALIKDSSDLRNFDAFRRQYGKANPFYDGLAERRIDDLRKVAAEAKARSEADAKQQRDERIAAEKRAAEEARKEDEAAAAKKKAEKAAAMPRLASCFDVGGLGIGVKEVYASYMAEAAMRNSAKAKLGDAVTIGPVSRNCEAKGSSYECHVSARACK